LYLIPPPIYSSNDFEDEPDCDSAPSENHGQSTGGVYETEGRNSETNGPSAILFSVRKQVSGFDYLENTKIYNFAIEGRKDKWAFVGGLSVANMDFRDDWEFQTQLDNPWSLDFGVEGRFYLSEEQHFLQPYVGLSLSYGSLFWSYRSSLLDPETGEVINKDHVDYIKLGAMAGIFVRLAKELRIGVEIRPVLLLPGTTTHHGFINDIIDDSKGTYAGVSVSLGY